MPRARRHQARLLPDGRLHLHDGPSDLVIAVFGTPEAIEAAYRRADRRFDGLIAELASELAVLRRPIGPAVPALTGRTARMMAAACHPFRDVYITPMAAVAGAVADTICAAIADDPAGIARAYVNNGGDIALYLAEGQHLDIGVVPSLARARAEGFIRISAASLVRGVATSGRHGRSFSLGIADAVTVLARSAAAADAAATIIANAVTLDDPAIVRRPAASLDPDSDLGDIPVTVDVGPLSDAQIAAALEAGAARARSLCDAGEIEGALLALRGAWRSVGGEALLAPPPASAS